METREWSSAMDTPEEWSAQPAGMPAAYVASNGVSAPGIQWTAHTVS